MQWGVKCSTHMMMNEHLSCAGNPGLTWIPVASVVLVVHALVHVQAAVMYQQGMLGQHSTINGAAGHTVCDLH